MEWQDLNGITGEGLDIGTVFRSEGREPYEKTVDFMLIEYPEAPAGLAFLVTSGTMAGHLLVKLPKESRPADSPIQKVSTGWLRKNWSNWVYGSDLARVRVCPHYQAV